ncbi:hypothetical protein PInf_006915 [Phytophthora infestans]|nr:hypothetical protein PInf_006915 [Phytophthora infestans]
MTLRYFYSRLRIVLEDSLLKIISLAEGLVTTKAVKAIAKDVKPSRKRTASKSPLRKEKEIGYSYRNLFGSSDEEDQEKEKGANYEPRRS